MSELDPSPTPDAIVRSLIMGELKPQDRLPHEVHGYYFSFFVESEYYPAGAAVAIQWFLQDDEVILAAPVHAYQYAEHLMALAERDTTMLPEVGSLLFKTLQSLHEIR